MIASPLASEPLFTVGPVPIMPAVVVTWGIMALLTLVSWLVTRRLSVSPTRGQATLELFVGVLDEQIRATMRVDPAPYLPLIGTLFLFILTANWAALVPGLEPPTARLETDAALGLIVFVPVIYFGVRALGPVGYLKTFLEPTWVMLPLNLVETLTRTFSLVVRLFGNIMSGVFVVGIVLSLAGLLVPIPLMALDLLTGAVQAYIFAVLAMVFIAGAVADSPRSAPQERKKA